MTKTNFAHGTAVTPEFLNAINNPVYSDNPSQDGQIPYPDPAGIGLTAEINRAEIAEADLEQSVSNCAKLGSGNLFQGSNHFAKVIQLGVAEMGGPDSGSIPGFALRADTAPLLRLVGYVIFLTGYLSQDNAPPCRFIVSNVQGYTWGVDRPVYSVSPVGGFESHSSAEHMTSAKLAEIIWDGAHVLVIEHTT